MGKGPKRKPGARENQASIDYRVLKEVINMVNAILFAVLILWLFALSVRQADFSSWLKTMKDERFRVLEFIDEAKASWNKDRRQEKEQ